MGRRRKRKSSKPVAPETMPSQPFASSTFASTRSPSSIRRCAAPYGLHAPYALRTIIELDAGRRARRHRRDAWRRRHRGAVRGAPTPRSSARIRFDSMGDLLPMIDPAARRQLDRSQTFRVPARTRSTPTRGCTRRIEIACLDLIGKALGRPVCDLLGGRVRDTKCRSRRTCSTSTPAAAARAATSARTSTARRSPRVDRPAGAADDGRLRLLGDQVEGRRARARRGDCEHARRSTRRSVPDVPLRIDPNSAWTVETSLQVGRSLAHELGRGGYLEDPTAGLDGMAAVRRGLLAEGIETPLASNVAVTSFADLKPASATRRRPDRPLRSALLGRHSPDSAPVAPLPGVRLRPVDALEQPSRRLADGHGARRRRGPAPDVRVRHALPVAG